MADQAPNEPPKQPVVAEAHEVDTYRKPEDLA
jgi:acetyl-CoA synthetase